MSTSHKPGDVSEGQDSKEHAVHYLNTLHYASCCCMSVPVSNDGLSHVQGAWLHAMAVEECNTL